MSLNIETLAAELRRLLPAPESPPAPVTLAAPEPAASPAAPAAEASSSPAPASLPEACAVVEHAGRGFQLDVRCPADRVVDVARLMDARGFGMDAVTGVDWLAEKEMEVVYDYFHPLLGVRVAVRSRVPRDNPVIPTVQEIFPGANWHERETHDFFGIRFEGHPDLSPFLLPEDADYHPLRKDFSA